MADTRSEARAKRRTTRVNKRLSRDVPLLVATGLEKPITMSEAAEQLAKHDRAVAAHFEKLEAYRRRTAEHAQHLRSLVAGLVSDAELRALDEQRRIYPSSPEYGADHWGQQLRRLAPHLATQQGYPPVPMSMPVNRHGGHALLRRGGEDAERLRAYLDELDRRAEVRAGGEQLDLLTHRHQQSQERSMMAEATTEGRVCVDGFTWPEVERMLFDSVVLARCTDCGQEYDVEPDAEGYNCHAGCRAMGTVTSPLIKLDLL